MSEFNLNERARISQLSDQLEELPHVSAGFHSLLDDTRVSSETIVTCDDVMIESRELPAAMIEAHYFPGRFALTNFKADLVQFRPDVMQSEDWNFYCSYKVNGEEYTMSANAASSILTTTNFESTELQFTFTPDIAYRFLASIALGALRAGESFDIPETDVHKADLPTKLRHFMYLTGAGNGQYSSVAKSLLLAPEQDFGLLVTKAERETRSLNQESYSYRLIHRIGEELLADTKSQQTRTIRFDLPGKTIGEPFGEETAVGTGHEILFQTAERQPGYNAPEDLAFIELLEKESDDLVIFLPEIDRLEYERINAMKMTLLGKYLDSPRYHALDNLPSIEELPEEAFELVEPYRKLDDQD